MRTLLVTCVVLIGSASFAGNSPKGDCLLKNQKTRSEAYGKCNKEFNTTTTNDKRQACIKEADTAFKTEQDRCMTLSDTPAAKK